MASLWSSLTWRGRRKLEQNYESEDLDEALRKRSLSARSRKSLSNIFHRPTNSDCEEAAHYPIYDPTNPEHGRPVPTTPSTPKKKPALQRLADTMRSTANILHVTKSPQESPLSASSKSKKSVRFRDCYVDKASSPIGIPEESPKLHLDFSDVPILTARPSLEKSVLKAVCEVATPNDSPIRQPQPMSALPTPMPGTNLPMEDPFQDVVVDAKRDHVELPAASKSLQVTIEDGFVSKEDEERSGGLECVPRRAEWSDSVFDLGDFHLGRLPELPSSRNCSAMFDQDADWPECSDVEALASALPRYEEHKHDRLAPPGQQIAASTIQDNGDLQNTLIDVSNEIAEPPSFQEFLKETAKVPYRKSRVELGCPFVLTATPRRVYSREVSIDSSSVRNVSGEASTILSGNFPVEGPNGENPHFSKTPEVQDDSDDA